MAEIVQVQPDENQIVVQIMDSAYEIAMAEAEDAAGITPRDESAPTPRFVDVVSTRGLTVHFCKARRKRTFSVSRCGHCRFFRAIPMEFVRPGPVLFSNGDIVEYLSEDNEVGILVPCLFCWMVVIAGMTCRNDFSTMLGVCRTLVGARKLSWH